MLKRISEAQNRKKADEIVELNLDNCESDGTIEGLTDDFSTLQNLSMANAKLKSLKGFPKLIKLKQLELCGNSIDGGLSSLAGCISLQHINLSGNQINDINQLTPLADLKSLTSLDLSDCDITKQADYREKVFELITSLQVLDGCEKEVEEEQNGDGNSEAVPHIEAVNEDESSESGGSEEEYDEEEVGLSYLERDDISDDEEDGDYEEEDDEEDEEIDEEDDEEARGVKRKLEDEEDS